MSNKLYIDSKKQHWVVMPENESLICDITKSIIKDFCFVVTFLDKSLGNKTLFLSLDGLRQVKKSNSEVTVYTQALITDFKTADLRLVLPETLELQPAKSVGYGSFGIVEDVPSAESDDYSNAPLSKEGFSLEGSSVGAGILEDKSLTDEEFELIVHAKPKNELLLEDKKENVSK